MLARRPGARALRARGRAGAGRDTRWAGGAGTGRATLGARLRGRLVPGGRGALGQALLAQTLGLDLEVVLDGVDVALAAAGIDDWHELGTGQWRQCDTYRLRWR
jgi:hypothetical protein